MSPQELLKHAFKAQKRAETFRNAQKHAEKKYGGDRNNVNLRKKQKIAKLTCF